MLPPHRSGYNDEAVRYEVPMILKLLPRLRLDTLTIIADAEPEFAYFTLEMFLSEGHGWKTLRFITPMSSIFSFDPLPPPHALSDEVWFQRKSQPMAWHESLLLRDGLDSGASVVIYRSTCPGVPGSVLDPSRRERFGQTAPCPEPLEKFGTTENEGLLADNERLRETLTIVKRGRSADISDVGGLPFVQRILGNGALMISHGNKLGRNLSILWNPERDVYNDPDEYGEPHSISCKPT
ncbi:hypothetical protein ACO22_07805 [Paracoccidioides brasiliensis]|uniref:Uncharacterized protein n=1 Tax=Paracoccidioides brasiliensis TaxID=121759 RepID=A0A1D2J3M8_PARBR|nr:hypothetical protein ACO22_07805 [Paracoccidioides brasiliensis]